MKKRYLLLLFIASVMGAVAQGQTLAQAKTLYGKGEYEKAKPTFRRLVKQQPSNGNYNLWYGICCLHTGEVPLAVKHLETAVKRRTTSGQFYLGQAYDAAYRFEEAVATLEEYISELKHRKRSTDKAQALLDKCRMHLRMMKGVEKVCVVDSFVVDKDNLLAAYRISPESGQLYMYNEYFDRAGNNGGTVYETELANKLYYSERQADGTLSILQRSKMGDRWGRGTLLPGSVNEAVNASFPYVLTDGVTIYYAADGENSMGGYDIFVTRYNTDTDTYLTPENVGMPFNSPYNDYMYVIDEFSNLGWFASDRYQPEGKVCVYLFVPNDTKQVYNYEHMDFEKLVGLARLQSIRDTWQDANAVRSARGRLQHIGADGSADSRIYDFEFVLNDATTYYQLSDFRSPAARQAFQKFQLMQKGYKQQCDKLEELREAYAKASDADKQKKAPAILDLEKNILRQELEVAEAEKEVRKLELN